MMKCRVLAICVLSLAMLIVTHPAVSAPAQDSACVTVTIRAMSSTGTFLPGTNLGLTGMYQNCSSRKARYTYTVTGMSSCGQKVAISSGRVAFDAGEARIWSIAYPIPSNMCAGSWEATIQMDGNGQLSESGTTASASTTVTIL